MKIIIDCTPEEMRHANFIQRIARGLSNGDCQVDINVNMEKLAT